MEEREFCACVTEGKGLLCKRCSRKRIRPRMTRRREVIVHTSRREQASVTQGGKDSLKVRKKMKKRRGTTIVQVWLEGKVLTDKNK